MLELYAARYFAVMVSPRLLRASPDRGPDTGIAAILSAGDKYLSLATSEFLAFDHSSTGAKILQDTRQSYAYFERRAVMLQIADWSTKS
jgi:hypothetical protein